MLRPLITLGTAAIAIAEPNRDARRLFYDKLKMNGVPKVVDGALDVDLTGRTVSDLVVLYKSLARIEKAAAKSAREWKNPHTPMTWEFSGDAAGLDLAALAKEPTPAEDMVVMRKVRKTASLTGAQWARALVLLGIEAETVKEGRKLLGFSLAIPGIDEEPTLFTIAYGTLKTAWAEEAMKYRYDPTEEEKAAIEDAKARNKATKDWFTSKASALMGLDDLSENTGLPARARDYRKDLTIRTCPVCFRDIKASDHTDNLMADHGFTILGRGYDGWGGIRRGSCDGTGHLPWEKSCDPAKKYLVALEAMSERVATRLDALKTGKVTSLEVDDKYDRKTREYTKKTVTPDDGYEWKTALKRAIFGTERALAALWDGNYGSIPWYRMAIRTWEPVADDHIAIGAPKGRPSDEDFINKPEGV